MARSSTAVQKWCREDYLSLMIIFNLATIFGVGNSQPSPKDCSLNFKASPFLNRSGCEGGNWGGFLSKDCCGNYLDRYLYALGRRANQTGNIFLNATEQEKCLRSMENSSGGVLGCGIDKLAGGRGRCFEFTVGDVRNKLGDEMKSLGDDCEFSGLQDGANMACSVCRRSWDAMGASFLEGGGSVNDSTNICKFAVLVTLTSSKIDDDKWILRIYQCLGERLVNQEAQQSSGKKNTAMRTGIWVLTGAFTGLAIVILFASWHLVNKRHKSQSTQQKNASKELLLEDPGCQKITVEEIYAATNSLNALNFIGQGIAGKVYRGMLSNGWHVAVKHIVKDGYVETFMREVTSLSHVKHPNLVTLRGYCEEEDECFLVYELCSNGNLSEWLFGKDKVLSWIQRLEIAIGSARGLWFLHTYPEGCIVHRDIKPTNILLGADFEAKLSDFGLSKVMDLGVSYVSSEVRGTFGYVDPEYRQNHHVNSSGDVYSFGVVLLQILSRKRVMNLDVNIVKRPMALAKMAKLLLRGGNISEFADPKLNGEYSVEAFMLTLQLALSCTAHKQQRPSMEQVVARLENALDISTRGSNKFSNSSSNLC